MEHNAQQFDVGEDARVENMEHHLPMVFPANDVPQTQVDEQHNNNVATCDDLMTTIPRIKPVFERVHKECGHIDSTGDASEGEVIINHIGDIYQCTAGCWCRAWLCSPYLPCQGKQIVPIRTWQAIKELRSTQCIIPQFSREYLELVKRTGVDLTNHAHALTIVFGTDSPIEESRLVRGYISTHRPPQMINTRFVYKVNGKTAAVLYLHGYVFFGTF
jgi:hypothetical protein